MLVYQRVIFVEFPHPPSKITKVPIVGSARSPFSKAPAKRQRPGAPKKLLFLLSVDEIYCLYVVFQWLSLFLSKWEVSFLETRGYGPYSVLYNPVLEQEHDARLQMPNTGLHSCCGHGLLATALL